MPEDDDAGGIDLEYFLEDISEESSTRIAGATLIIAGSLLGVILGLLLVSSNPNQKKSEVCDRDIKSTLVRFTFGFVFEK